MKLQKKVTDFLNFKFEMKEFRQDDFDFFFEGFLSTFGNEDRDGDIIDKGAFTESLKEHKPVLLFSHNTDEPLGVFDSLEEIDEGLFIKARMPLADVFVKDRIIPQMKIGSITAMSIGFSIEDFRLDTVIVDNIRHLKKVFLWEGSLVTIPANEEARIKSKKINSSDLENIDARPFEKMLTNGTKFSRKSAKKVISCLKNSGFVLEEQPIQLDADDTDNETKEMIALIKSTTKTIKEQNGRNN